MNNTLNDNDVNDTVLTTDGEHMCPLCDCANGDTNSLNFPDRDSNSPNCSLNGSYENVNINWTVTEKGGGDQKVVRPLVPHDKCCCLSNKRKDNNNNNNNVTGPYVKRKKMDDICEYVELINEKSNTPTAKTPTVVSPSSKVRSKRSPGKSSLGGRTPDKSSSLKLNDSATSCALM